MLDPAVTASSAAALFPSPTTVRNYVSALLDRTGCKGPGQLLVRARDAGLAGG